MKHDVYFDKCESITILRLEPMELEEPVYGYYKYYIDVVEQGVPLKDKQILILKINNASKVMLLDNILTRRSINHKKYRTTLIATSPLIVLKRNYIKRSWVNKSLKSVLEDILGPIKNCINYNLYVNSELIIDFLYQPSDINSFTLFNSILGKYGLLLNLKLSGVVLDIVIYKPSYSFNDISNLDHISFKYEEKLAPQYMHGDSFKNKNWRLYKDTNQGIGLSKHIVIITGTLNIRSDELYTYRNSQYMVSGLTYKYKVLDSYDLVAQVDLVCIDNIMEIKQSLKSFYIGESVSTNTYEKNGIPYVQSDLDGNKLVPIPIIEVVNTRANGSLKVLHTYKSGANICILSLYNSIVMIALPSSYDTSNRSNISKEKDMLLQSDRGNIFSSDQGVGVCFKGSYNMLSNKWYLNSDVNTISSKDFIIVNVQSKMIRANESTSFNIDNTFNASFDKYSLSSDRVNAKVDNINITSKSLTSKVGEMVVSGEDVVANLKDSKVSGGLALFEGMNMLIKSKSITFKTPGAMISISESCIKICAAKVAIGNEGIHYSGKVMRS